MDKKIKKHFGEGAMKYCREAFPLILDTPGLLYNTLCNLVDKSDGKEFFKKLLKEGEGDRFKGQVYAAAQVKQNCTSYSKVVVNRTASEILDEAGYKLYHCKTVGDVEQFKKYYKDGESLCTFDNIYRRLETCHIFWIVKKELLSDIEAFDNSRCMERQDDYGTSCCSIQFSKSGYLSIKNRYNHKVSNCDATFSNNLDNIAEGLTIAFEKDFGVSAKDDNKSEVDVPGFVYLDKYRKYTTEVRGRYFGEYWYQDENFKVVDLDKSCQFIADYILIDVKNKSIRDLVYKDTGLDATFEKVVIFKNEEEYRKEADEFGVLKIYKK